jgi:hypothetical protein
LQRTVLRSHVSPIIFIIKDIAHGTLGTRPGIQGVVVKRSIEFGYGLFKSGSCFHDFPFLFEL